MPLLRIVREGVPPRGSPRHVLCGTPIPSPGFQPGFGLRPHPPGEPADSGIPCRRGQGGTPLGFGTEQLWDGDDGSAYGLPQDDGVVSPLAIGLFASFSYPLTVTAGCQER